MADEKSIPHPLYRVVAVAGLDDKPGNPLPGYFKVLRGGAHVLSYKYSWEAEDVAASLNDHYGGELDT